MYKTESESVQSIASVTLIIKLPYNIWSHWTVRVGAINSNLETETVFNRASLALLITKLQNTWPSFVSHLNTDKIL